MFACGVFDESLSPVRSARTMPILTRRAPRGDSGAVPDPATRPQRVADATRSCEAARGFRKLTGHRGMPILTAALRTRDSQLDPDRKGVAAAEKAV
jgi:hypothetical protein